MEIYAKPTLLERPITTIIIDAIINLSLSAPSTVFKVINPMASR